MLNIIERLDRKKFAPAVCVMNKGGDLDQEVERLGLPFIEAPFTVQAQPYHTLVFRAWKAAQVFRPYRFSMWHSFHYLDDYTEPMIARLAGAKAWVYTKKNMNWHRRSWILRSFLATRIVSQNTDMIDNFFKSKHFRLKTHLIQRGVDTATFSPQSCTCQKWRKQVGISSDTIVVGCVAHLVPVKGHPTLLRAIAQVSDMHVLIAGKPLDQAYVASLEQMVRDLGIKDRVHFVGNVDDVPNFLAEVDIFVLPTWSKWRQEGCPVALLEAMACGKACVATDIPGSRDLIESGNSGLLVVPENDSRLAETLDLLYNSSQLRGKLGQAARARVVDQFSIEQEVLAHERLYTHVLGSES